MRRGKGELAIVDTTDGERMQLTVKHHVDDLVAVVVIKRPDGTIERLPLEESDDYHHALLSTVAPAEPHEFDAELVLVAGMRRDVLTFRMEEPEGHHH